MRRPGIERRSTEAEDACLSPRALVAEASPGVAGQSALGRNPPPSLYIDFTMNRKSEVTVRPAHNVRGSVRLPGDKSISHRYAMLAGIAEGPSRLENYSTGADCASTLECMRTLGVSWTRKAEGDNVIEVQGRGDPAQPP